MILYGFELVLVVGVVKDVIKVLVLVLVVMHASTCPRSGSDSTCDDSSSGRSNSGGCSGCSNGGGINLDCCCVCC